MSNEERIDDMRVRLFRMSARWLRRLPAYAIVSHRVCQRIRVAIGVSRRDVS